MIMSCPTGILLDFSDETLSGKDKPGSPLSSTEKHEVFSTKNDGSSEQIEQVCVASKSSSKPSTKLCGYLTKVSYAGPIKTSKTRWFAYKPESCELVYSRNADSEDRGSICLGKIPLRRASFNFTAGDLQDNMFSISANGIVHTLQACDQKTLLWWLQELQSRRRAFNEQRFDDHPHKPDWHGSILGSSVFWVPNEHDMASGLLKANNASNVSSIQHDTRSIDEPFRIFPMDEEPPDTIGIKAATLQKPRSASILSGSGLATISGRIPVPKLDDINAALTNAGESAKKTLKTQAQRLKPATVKQAGAPSCEQTICPEISASTSPTPKFATAEARNSPMSLDKGYLTFVNGLKQEVLKLKEELDLMKMKIQTKEESVQVLRMELQRYEHQSKRKDIVRHQLSDEERELRSEVIGLKLSNDRLQQEIDESRSRETDLTEKNSMLREMLTIKDDIVVQLSNQLHDLELSHKSLSTDYAKLEKEKNEEFVVVTPANPQEDITGLKDKLEGFMMQNKLLNNEILELANLRRMDDNRIIALDEKLVTKEAELCQLNSKYLVLLAEMNKPRSDSVGLAVAGSKVESSDQDRKDMVKILIKEALEDTVEAAHAGWSMRRDGKYDQFGFSCWPEDDAESSLLAAASHMAKKAGDFTHSIEEFHASVAVKWQNYFVLNKELQRNEDVKNLIRSGVPHQLRPRVWSWLVKHRTQEIRQKLDPDSKGRYYSQLLQHKEAPLASKQIELDLPRTLPNNRHFASVSSGGIDLLRRVLRAYSIHNPAVGYCQGLNRVAAVALLYLSEEEAFWCLVAIVECIMPENYYSLTLTASQADQRVFKDLMAEKIPRLHRHLEAAGVDSSLITFNWLLCIFCDNVPPETMLHIWDVFLSEGSKVLFRYGLAFFKSVEEEILQLKDYMSIFTFMRVMSHRMHDTRNLTQIAFPMMNPFPMRRINRLRAIHLEKVSAELRELDALRRGFVSFRRDAAADSDED